MAKAKQPIIEIEFVASLSEQSAGTEEKGGSDERPEGGEASREHDELVARYTQLASRAQSISEEIAIERYSESHLEETRRNLDWSVGSDRHDHFRLLMPAKAALVFLDAARPDLVEVVEAGGAIIKAGRTTIDLETPEDIDKAVKLIQKLNEPKLEKPASENKKAGAKKEAKRAKSKKPAKKKS
jgi:hypothetical protein